MNTIAIKKGIQQIFTECAEDDDRLFAAIESLARTAGQRTYHEALNHLFAKNFSVEKASRYWREATTLIRKPDGSIHSFRAALLDYLSYKTNELSDPRIIESSDLEKIRRSAVTDGLTQLYNQSYFKQQLQQMVELAQRETGQTFSLILFDLDHFKQFNDRCGHLQGDQVLREVGNILRGRSGEIDLPVRYGGEEFALLLPDQNLTQAVHLAETVRTAVDNTLFPGQDLLDSNNLSISGGVACYPQHGTTASQLIESADRNLYKAKVTRNRIQPRLDETRHASRHQYRNIVEIKISGQDRFSAGLSDELSRTGLSLKSDCAPPIGTPVTLRFRSTFWPQELETQAAVRHVANSATNGAYRLGIQFDEPLDEFCDLLLPRSLKKNA